MARLFLVGLAILAFVSLPATGEGQRRRPRLNPSAVTNAGHLWVDTDGGTCTRQSTAGSWVDAQGCSSLNTAYAAASCGDTIRVKAGTYASVTIAETAGGTACGDVNRVVMRPSENETVNIPHIGLGTFGGTSSPDNLTLIGFVTRLGISLYGDVNNVTVKGFDGGSFITGPSSSADDSTNIVIEDSDWGPCGSRSTIGECSHSGVDTCNADSPVFCNTGRNHIEGNNSHWVDGVIIRNNTFHDYPIETEGDHWECVFVEGGTNVTFERNRGWNCITNVVALPDTELFGTWYFQNNWFGDAGSTNASLKFGLAGGCPVGTVIVRFNSFSASNSVGSEEGGSCSNIHVIGNILGEEFGCFGFTHRYNRFLDANGCDATDVQIGALPYVNTSGLSSMNYHLNDSSADDFVPGSVTHSDLSTDYDGDNRSAPRDAGADQHTGPPEPLQAWLRLALAEWR